MPEEKKFQEKSDEELAEISRLDPDAYYHLMLRYEEKISRYARRISGVSKETAQDLTQEIFLKAYQNLWGFESDLKFSSWLYRIAGNHIVSHWRKNKKSRMVYSLDADDNFKNIPGENENPGVFLDKEKDRKVILSALGRISEDYRRVLVLRFMEDKDYQEISDIIKKPIGTVGTIISRAKKTLRKELECFQKDFDSCPSSSDGIGKK